ncbi:MAG TPA: urea ABC transporter permease subunit UrtB, partial [Noviherbaspirillum sp.]|nr:urea ABC transporter permease subunit UrtB [Noviherbaspirillum sp.]
MKPLRHLLIALWLCGLSVAAHAAIDPQLLKPLAGDDPDARIEAVNEIAALGSDDAYRVLSALRNYGLYATGDGSVLVVDGSSAWNPATGETGPVPADADSITVNNRLRNVLQGALSGFRLFSPDRNVRLAAAQEMQRNADAGQLPLIEQALEKETDARIRDVLEQAAAMARLESDDPALRRSAIEALAGSSNASLVPTLRRLLEKDASGEYIEPDAGVRDAAHATVRQISARLKRNEFISN